MRRISSIILSSVLLLAATSATAVPRPGLSVAHQAPNQEVLEMFSGTIVSMENGMLALKEDTKDLLYGLDDQALARQFIEKKVLVTGTLDTAMIHVKTIEEKKSVMRWSNVLACAVECCTSGFSALLWGVLEH